MKIIDKIITILILIKNVLIRKKKYRLRFKAERDSVVKRWYYDFPNWGFSHDNLEMVSGADGLCEKYAEGRDNVTIDIIASKRPLDIDAYKEYDEYRRYEYSEFTLGASYINKVKKLYTNEDGSTSTKEVITTMWICPVTLFVLGRYPRYIYIKPFKKEKK